MFLLFWLADRGYWRLLGWLFDDFVIDGVERYVGMGKVDRWGCVLNAGSYDLLSQIVWVRFC